MGLLGSILRLRPDYIRQVQYAFLLLILSIATGILGFMLIEDYSFVEALFMTIITISTVGFREVHELSDPGRLFTVFLIVTNIGIFTYAISIIGSFIVEGQLKHAFKDFKVAKEITQISNHIIICGFGRNGQQAAEELKEHKQQFVVIETDNKKIEKFRISDSLLYVEGDASQDEVMEKAGIKRAKALISTLPKDADNVFVALTARGMNPNLIIVCRAIEDTSEVKLKRAGANHVIMPEKIGGSHMARLITKPDIIDFFQVLAGAGGVSLYFEELDIERVHKNLKNKTIRDLEIRKQTGANIIGLKTNEGKYIVNPSPDTAVGNCSKLIVLGDDRQIENFNTFILTSSD